jgi:hypothetical protein
VYQSQRLGLPNKSKIDRLSTAFIPGKMNMGLEKGLRQQGQPDVTTPRHASPSGTLSDVRLKHKVVRLAVLPSGLNLYRFMYSWSDQAVVGVMAQEVLLIDPSAVLIDADGFYRVIYDRLGIEMITYADWQQRIAGGKIPFGARLVNQESEQAA